MKRKLQADMKRDRLSGVIDLTEKTLASTLDGHPFAVIDFWAPSSATSRAFAPTFARAAMRNPDVLFAKVNAESQKAICVHFNVASPTLMIFRGNIVVFDKAGSLTAGELDEVLAAVRSLDMEQVRRKVADVETIIVDAADVRAAGPDPREAEASDDATPSIESYLRPAVAAGLRNAGPLLAAGGLIAIHDAFDKEFAERMFSSLDACKNWRVHEGREDHFHYHHHNLYESADYPDDLTWCSRMFDSLRTRSWVTRLSGRSCVGSTEVSASRYLPGDHSLPHNDIADSGEGHRRQVAFVWHLTKDWRPEWGGALYWCSRGTYLPAAFNTLFMFNVGPDSNHFVTHVSPYARGKRLAINGWWTGPGATGALPDKGPERLGADGAEIDIY